MLPVAAQKVFSRLQDNGEGTLEEQQGSTPSLAVDDKAKEPKTTIDQQPSTSSTTTDAEVGRL